MKNEMELIFDAVSANESFARVVVAAFISHLDPTLEQLDDVKTAVSEAVTNSIIHGYENYDSYYGREQGGQKINPGRIRIYCRLEEKVLHIEVSDTGIGIADLKQAMEPLYTSKPDLERSGMGFAFMEAFMDQLDVESSPGRGTTVRMSKRIGTDSRGDSEE